jgi:pyrroloquinoline quinone (PQQ) biosynthesis protein C
MATGLPLIATNWAGPADYMTAEDSFLLSYELQDARGTVSDIATYHGQWAEPDYEHLRYLLRHVYEHPDEAQMKGMQAAQRVHQLWTWDRVAETFCHDIDQLVAELDDARAMTGSNAK